jgi:hypothetical protein
LKLKSIQSGFRTLCIGARMVALLAAAWLLLGSSVLALEANFVILSDVTLTATEAHIQYDSQDTRLLQAGLARAAETGIAVRPARPLADSCQQPDRVMSLSGCCPPMDGQ